MTDDATQGWPKELENFEKFLKQQGLVCQIRSYDRAHFGNRILEYRNASIAVRAVLDRGDWFVDVDDVVGHPGEWYDAAIVRDFLVGRGEGVLSLADQVRIVETNWRGILDSFAPQHVARSHERLSELRKERVKRLFPDWARDI